MPTARASNNAKRSFAISFADVMRELAADVIRELAAEPLTSIFLLSVVTALILRALWRLQARLLSSSSDLLLSMNATLFIKPERRHDFLECIQRAESATNQEPLAVLYLYGEDEQTPNTFHVHQEYKGRAGLDAHRRTEHYEAWRRFAATDPFTAPPQSYVFAAALVPSAAAPTEPPLLCMNVRLTVKPERREEFLREIAADQRGTMRDEPLARRMLVGEDEAAPNTFHLHEQARTRRAPRRRHSPPDLHRPSQPDAVCAVCSRSFAAGAPASRRTKRRPTLGRGRPLWTRSPSPRGCSRRATIQARASRLRRVEISGPDFEQRRRVCYSSIPYSGGPFSSLRTPRRRRG